MFKRKAEGTNSENPAKKGGPQTAAEEKTDPIPRHLPDNVVTLNFACRNWQEFAPEKLYYLPLNQTIKYMFDTAMINQLDKYKHLWHTMEILDVGYELSDLLMLQDDLRVQNSTPTDATAFTQVVYIVEYTPAAQINYFKLQKLTDAATLEGTDLSYKMAPEGTTNNKLNQMVEIQGFSTFDETTILPARVEAAAGFRPFYIAELDDTGEIQQPYLPPTLTNDLALASGNLNLPDNNLVTSHVNYLKPAETLTLVKNQDKIAFFKYGDTLTRSVNTNLSGIPLLNTESNDPFADDQILIPKPDTQNDKWVYSTEWSYPGRNRPFFSRADNLSRNNLAVTGAKAFKPLKHRFYCMPPIRKPDGSLLGQRCSCIVQQHCVIRFKLNQAIFTDNEDENMQIEQNDGVILRRNIYGKPRTQTGSNSVWYPANCIVKCETIYAMPKRYPPLRVPEIKCYNDSFTIGLKEFCESISSVDMATFISVSSKPPDNINAAFNVITKPGSWDSTYFEQQGFQAAWKYVINSPNINTLCAVFLNEPQKVTISGQQYFQYIAFGDEPNGRFYSKVPATEPYYKYLYWNFDTWNLYFPRFQMLRAISCDKPNFDQAPVDDKINVFYC